MPALGHHRRLSAPWPEMASVQSAPGVAPGGMSLPMNLTPQGIKEIYQVRARCLMAGLDVRCAVDVVLMANRPTEISADEGTGRR